MNSFLTNFPVDGVRPYPHALTSIPVKPLPQGMLTLAGFSFLPERLTAELREQIAQSTKLGTPIWANLEDIGYGK